MQSLIAALLLGLYAFSSAFHPARASSEPETPAMNVFEIFKTMPYIYGIFDMDKDGDLDCSTAEQTELNEDEQSATYIWEITGPDGEPRTISFTITATPGSDQASFTMGEGDQPASSATYLYADYKTCTIAAAPLLGRPECVMGVSEETKTNVSKSCITAFEENCHTKVLGFDKDTCSKW